MTFDSTSGRFPGYPTATELPVNEASFQTLAKDGYVARETTAGTAAMDKHGIWHPAMSRAALASWGVGK